MKQFIIAAALIAGCFSAATAQDFKPKLQETFLSFDTNYNNETARLEAANKLILIAKKWPDEWITNYYAAYSRIQLSYSEKDETKRDAYLDEAETYYNEAVRLSGKETDETHVLAAMMANARMAVKPQQRWQKYGKIFDDQLEAAKTINENNPRIYYMKGVSKFYTPAMFGGGKDAAKPYFEKADELFKKETTDDIAVVHWGKSQTAYFLDLCNKKD